MYSNTIYRFKQIVKVLAFYGFGYLINTSQGSNKSSPENLRKAFEELGPSFIKIGQILGSRPDIVSAVYIEELIKLEAPAPVESYENINKVFYGEFLSSIDTSFLYFDKNPCLVNPAFQIYNAILKDGREVAVKIQRPDFLEKIKTDISILNRLMKVTKASFIDILINPEDALSEVLYSAELELDFNNEAQNIERFRTLNSDVAFLHVPYVIWNLTTSKVITLEKIKGFMIKDTKRLTEGGYNIMDLGKKLTLCYFKQIFKDGFFHGNPLSENLLIDNGTLSITNFSIMGSLNNSLKAALNYSISSLVFKDIDKLVSVMLSIGIKRKAVNRQRLYEDLKHFIESHRSISFQEIKLSVLLKEILKIAKINNLSLPKDFTIFIRCIFFLEEVISSISPDMNLLSFTVSFFKSNNNPLISSETDLGELLVHSFSSRKDSFASPSKFTALIDNLINGETKIQLEIRNLNKLTYTVIRLIKQAIIGIILGSVLIASSIIISTNVGYKTEGLSFLGFSVLSLIFILMMLLFISITRSKR